MASTDRIERSIELKAPRSRVWRALTSAPEFGTWFRAALRDQAFVPGRTTRGPTTYPGYEHVQFEVVVERMEPESYFSWRWHPYAVEPGVDYSGEPTTLVEFTLEDTEDGGTRLTVVESGFDALPAGRRDEAYRMNTGGWEGQMENIATHLRGGLSMARRISTFLMFQDGNAETAMQLYASLFADAKIGRVERWAAGEPGKEGKVKLAEFELAGHRLMCSESPVKHAFDFTPSVSLFIDCADAEEFERLYAALSENGTTLMPPDDYGFSPRFAWCNDRFGVSWQLNLPSAS